MGTRLAGAEAVHRETLAEQVAEQLMRSIVEQRLRPGDPLPSELQLTSRYHVSRSVTREALRHLAALHIIQLSNGKVPVVKPVTGELLSIHYDWALQVEANSFVELQELRRGVEGACAYHAALRRTPDDVAELTRLMAGMGTVTDQAAFIELDIAFHLAVAHASHNRLLAQTVESVAHTLGDFVRTGVESMERAPHTEPPLVVLQRGHRKVADPILAGDAEQARARMDEHLRAAINTYVTARATGPRSGHLEASR